MAGGPPSPAKRSFIDLFKCSSSDSSMPLKESSIYRGEPALRFSAEEVASLASSLKFALVGKFSNGRPSMATLRKSFCKIDLKGSIKLGLLDKRHILIRAENEDDFLRLRLRKFWSFEGFVMRIFKWTPDFRTDIESPLVPVWVSFESLPIFMFNKGSLFSLARIIGTPLKIDAATSDLSRPSVARVCVEVDLRQDLPNRLWLDIGTLGFWQTILYEDLPKYCLACCKVGHIADVCKSLKPASQKAAAAPSLPKPKWMPKPALNHPLAGKIAEPLFSAIPNEDVLALPSTDLVSAVLPSTIAAIAADDAAAIPDEGTVSGPSTSDAIAAAVPAAPVPASLAVSGALVVAAELEEVADAVVVSVAAGAQALATHAAAVTPAVPPILEASATRVVLAAEVEDAASPPCGFDFLAASANEADRAVALDNNEAASADKDAVPLMKESAPKCSGLLNPNAPLFSPQIHSFAKQTLSFAEALLDEPQTGKISVEPIFFAVKSAEFPSFQLPQFAEFYTPSSFNPPIETNSPQLRDDIYTLSDGDDVPRWPAPRDVILNSLRSFNNKIENIFGKRRSFLRCSTERKKWKKRAPISESGPALSSIVPPPLNALAFHGPNPFEEQSDDNASVQYESQWHSSTSDEDNCIDFSIPLASEAALMALEYEDFSPPGRRKYNKRFRDLPAPMTTRSFRNRF